MYVVDSSIIVTGSFPRGCILLPLTAQGMTVDISRLSLCSLRQVMVASPATERSAPESGNASISDLPFKDKIYMRIVGADSMAQNSQV